jgi:hypothetical protein
MSPGSAQVGAATPVQKPPTSEKLPPLIGDENELASGWPIVPVSAKLPPELVAPPPSMVDHGIVYWLNAAEMASSEISAADGMTALLFTTDLLEYA